ncbi:MAG: addiction module component [Rhizonema sp. NSF051]|nr:addiction module component [Rhizonema sp. NSF051]
MARKKKVKGISAITRIASIGSLKLNKWKSDELDIIASRLGFLRSDLWNEYGSLKAWGISSYEIDKILRLDNAKYNILAKTWETTVTDVIDDIHTCQASCIEKVLRVLGLRYEKATARKSIAQHVLESREWLNHPKLQQLVRKFWYRGHTHVNNQIVVREYNCQTDINGIVWIQFAGLKKGKVLRIPTTLKQEITGQFRLIKRSSKWYIHYITEVVSAPKRTEGIDIGIDRGYSEVFATSSNDGAKFIGTDFGSLQTTEADCRNEKGKRRNKIRAIAAKARAKSNYAKAQRIKKNNLGRIKWNSRELSFKGRIRTLVFTATVALMHNAIKSVGYEDLTEQFTSKAKRSKRIKRNLSLWCKGVVADALSQVSSRVGCTIIPVNAAYTSQLDSRHGILLGARSGDKFTCFDGVVLQADTNAADTVRARTSDDEITRFMKHTDVKKILLNRTQKFQSLISLAMPEAKTESFEATTGKDKPKTLEPKRKRTSKVNQRANTKQGIESAVSSV